MSLDSQSHVRDIFGDIPEYSKHFIRDLIDARPAHVIANGALAYQDQACPLYNVVNHYRLTTDTPASWENTIYLLGASHVECLWGPDWMTTASYLQRECNRRQPNRYRVLNMGIAGAQGTFGVKHFLLQLLNMPLTPGDIVILQYRQFREGNQSFIGCIVRMHCLTRKKGARFVYQCYPSVERILNPSAHEMLMAAAKSPEDLLAGRVDIAEHTPPTSYMEPEIVAQLLHMGVEAEDLQPYIERPHDLGEIFIDQGHIVYRGNARLAEATYTRFIADNRPGSAHHSLTGCGSDMRKKGSRNHDIKAIRTLGKFVAESYAQQPSMQEWLASVEKPAFAAAETAKIGAIVMNANPFTLGHLHLIEEALKKVTGLFIFLVEEDQSEFSFAERLAMVRAGVAHLGDRVLVAASGEFIISSLSFPTYFTKELTYKVTDPSLDVLLFGSIIAPYFKIKIRFVGKEPLCITTRQYNAAMLRYLPPLGVKVRVIPRTGMALRGEDEMPISASRVRQLIAHGDIEGIRSLVPRTTFQYLVKSRRVVYPSFWKKLLQLLGC